MKKYFKWLMKKVTYRHKQKLIEKLVGPHNKLGHSSKESIIEERMESIIEERMEGKRTRGRPRRMLVDWMMKYDYSKLKERAGHRVEWRHWTYEQAWEGREPRRRRVQPPPK